MPIPPFASGKTIPAGSNTQIQFNKSSKFGANAGFTFDNTNVAVSIVAAGDANQLYVKGFSLTQTNPPILFVGSDGTNRFWVDGKGNIYNAGATGFTLTNSQGGIHFTNGNSGSTSTITTNAGALVLEMTGGASGAINLQLLSQTGITGALFQNETAELVDFQFEGPSVSNKLTIRWENRSGHNFLTGNSVPEFQIGLIPLGTSANNYLIIGTSQNAFPNGNLGILNTNPTSALTIGSSGQFQVNSSGLIPKYNNISTVGWGVPAIYASGRSTAQTAAVASVATYTVGSADGSFEISANVNVTAFAVGTFNVIVNYTDETNTSNALKLSFSSLTGSIGVAVAAAGAFEGIPVHIRCKASTGITIATTGTFTSITYNVEAIIRQLA